MLNPTRLLLPLLALAYLATGVHTVRPDERAVVRRLGRVVARPGPGLWVGLPWGLDRVDRVRVRAVRQLAVGFDPDAPDDGGGTPPGRLLTGDQNLVDVRLGVENGVDPGDDGTGLDDYLTNRDAADAILTRETEGLAAEWVAGRPVDEVLLTGRAELPGWVLARLPGRLAPHRLGLAVGRVTADHLAPPAEVRESFEAVNQAQTGIRTAENGARREADRRRQEADAVRVRLGREAEAARREKLSAAAAEAEAFSRRLDGYRRLRASNPDVLAAIWWDEMGRTLLGLKGRGRIDVLDDKLGAGGPDLTQFVSPGGK